MLIIAGHLELDAQHRDAFVEAHRDLVTRARQTPGCLDLAITADPLDQRRANNYERWASREALDRWRAVANAPDTKFPIHNADVWLYEVGAVQPPF